MVQSTPRQNALRMSKTLSFRLIRISGCVLKSNVNRIKSRTAKFENKKSKLACEGRRKISLVLKFILRLIFKRLHPRVSCLHPQRKMREFRARWRSPRANFFHAVLLVALVLLCDSIAVKCGKANKTSRKCAGKIYFLSKELARAAELQEGSAIAVSTGTKFGGATTCARYLERTILEASGNSEFLRDFLLSCMP